MGHFEVASGAAGIISSIAVGVWSEKDRERDRQGVEPRGGAVLPSDGTRLHK